jgi:hypothetical protein
MDMSNTATATYTTRPVEATKIAALMAAKASDLTWYTRTLRNAARGAIRNGQTYMVTRTATQAHIVTSYDVRDASGLTLDYICHADGRIEQAVWA